MAKYTGTVLTNKGKELLARAILGETIVFTKVEIGEGILSPGADKESLTSLVESFKILSITSTTNLPNGGYRIRISFNNKGFVDDTYLREVGVYARGEDGVEILYSYCNTDTPNLIPNESSGIIESVEDIITYISSAATINAVIDESHVYATIKDLVEGLATKADTFNKSDSVNLNDSNTIATSKAAKTAHDRGSSGVTKAEAAQNSANAAQTKANQAYTLAASCPYGIGDYWITESTTNPATRWTGTIWIKLEGRTLLGTSSGYALGTQGGRSTVALTLDNIAAHIHGFSGTTNTTGNHYHQSGNHRHKVDNHAHTQPTHTHSISTRYNGGAGGVSSFTSGGSGIRTYYTNSGGGNNTGGSSPYTNYQNPNTSTIGDHSHTVSGTTESIGSGTAFNIMNPYRVVNIWRRTA